MIGRITGILLEKRAPELLVDVNGVGYEVLVSLTTFFDLPDAGAATTLHTHFVVREDAQQLYGFGSLHERELFRSLIKVNGVGPKMALTILSGMNPADFIRCVRHDDVAALVKLPGVGKKTAERLLVEMRDRVADLSGDGGDNAPAAIASGVTDSVAEAESALVSLGYKPAEATKMVAHANQDDPPADTSELIRRALKSAVKK